MHNKLTLILAMGCFLLAVLSAYLGFTLYQRSRFTHASTSNPYIMFDSKTTQSCWAGPANDKEDKFLLGLGGKSDPSWNPAKIPFCKDLK